MTLIAPRAVQKLDHLNGFISAFCALFAGFLLRNFTVDDALISLRYASNLRLGLGFRFNPNGAITDGVTPLVWPYLLSVFSKGTLWEALTRVQCFGASLHALAAYRLASRAFSNQSAPTRRARIGQGLLVALIGFALPSAAYAVSGMETPVAECLVAFGVTASGPLAGPLSIGCLSAATLFRPELLPFALAHVAVASTSPARALLACLVTPLPFAATMIARVVAFGSATPLSLVAKPSDLTHGLAYAGAGLVVTALPVYLASIRAFRLRELRATSTACIVHTLVIVGVGGDWMPYARMFAPIAILGPYLLARDFASVEAPARTSALVLRIARALLGAGCTLWFWCAAAPLSFHVKPDRIQLAQQASHHLGEVIASIDVGWPAAAAPQAMLVDLAGLTDPEFAFLPGGHTSKHVDMAMLDARHVDTVLLLVSSPPLSATIPWWSAPFARATEARLARAESLREHFTLAAFVALGTNGSGYLILRRMP